MSWKEILRKQEKHWSTEVSIPKFLVKFWNAEKFFNSLENWKNFCRNIWEKLRRKN